MNLKNKRIGILGMAKSGLAAAKKIQELGGIPFLSELKTEENINDSLFIKKRFECEFEGHTEKLFNSDLIIVSPGIPLNIPILQKAKAKKNKLISEIEFGYLLKHPASKIIAVTGSNGKSTTVSLIHHILQTAGYKSILAGNIGNALTSFPIDEKGIDFIVLELSSFQLDLIDTFKADVGVILNITPDHLNRYSSFDDYANSKMNIFQNQTENDLAIINLDDNTLLKFHHKISSIKKSFSLKSKADVYFDGNFIIHQKDKFSLTDTKLFGPHNIANIMASILAVSYLGINSEIIRKALKTFSPLPHRLEFITQINSVKFFNDSKATNTDSVKFALKSFAKPVRIIMGGSDKEEDYSVLNPLLKKHAKKIYLIGETANKMKEIFISAADISTFTDLKKCIFTAFSEAEKDDIILLSPGCASFDMFNNFEERGYTFKKIVTELKNEN
ncbi:MAG: UDP-N-acetylmuramoyl-L-alanine--D-glutamate ligase [Armatimonadetes bacterium]|nr:UDP-N-acetylmuramoyl-L-alanine--D-glutamate ligase [Armatimonadota bacterium]